MKRDSVVAIDLGSNTFRGVEMDCKSLEPIALYEKIVKTADGLHESGKIGDEAIERIIEAADEAKRVLNFGKPIVAVTTEAVRRASNAKDVIDRIKRETGIEFRTISGDVEASLTLLAVKKRLEKIGFKGERFVMVDIGGGSTEILFFDNGDFESRSFKVGIVTVAQKYKSLEKIEQEMPNLTLQMREFVEEKMLQKRPQLFVATAGTPTTVAAMKLGLTYKTYDASKVNGTVVEKSDLKIQLKRLLDLDHKSRQELVGVGREDLIAAGILIYEAIFSILGFDESIVVDDGLREGVAIAACSGDLKEFL